MIQNVPRNTPGPRFNRFSFVEILDRSGYSSRTAFAKAVGISAGALHDIITGRRQPSNELMQRFVAELKVPLPAVLSDPGEAA